MVLGHAARLVLVVVVAGRRRSTSTVPGPVPRTVAPGDVAAPSPGQVSSAARRLPERSARRADDLLGREQAGGRRDDRGSELTARGGDGDPEGATPGSGISR